MTELAERPQLFLDVDGVISLFELPSAPDVDPADFHQIEGVVHYIPPTAGERLVRLSSSFDLVWATGWEEKANEYLPCILGLPFRALPCLSFGGQAVFGSTHWKLDAIEEHAGDRPAAWIDDNLGDVAQLWALSREPPTLLVETTSARGMTDGHVERLLQWAESLLGSSSPSAGRAEVA